MSVSFGIDVSQHQQSWDELVSRVRFCEDLGLEHAWVFDHFKALYGDPSGPCMEAWTLLAALGVSTTRIRLGALVTGMTYRHPSILATEAVTVDHISGGRLNIGIGAAWFEGEHIELGVEFPGNARRASRLEEGIQVMIALMTADDTTFEGRYYSLRNAAYNPKPVQRPHPPFWVGASGPQRTLPVAGRYADVWHTYGGPERLRRRWEIVARHAEKAGRDPDDIARATNLSISEPLDEVRRRARAVVDEGITYIVLSWPASGRPVVEKVTHALHKDFGG